jgi:hypothetical protein
MSYSAPGPRRDIHSSAKPVPSVVEQARREAERLAAQQAPPPPSAASSRPARPEEQSSAAGPPLLHDLIDQEQVRVGALAANDAVLADRALGAVVRDLDALLDAAAQHLRTQNDRSAQIREGLPQVLGGLTAVPLVEVADLLDLPPTSVETVWTLLAEHGGITRAERTATLAGISDLRGRLQQAEMTRDHSLLDRLFGFVVKIAVLVGVAVAAAPLGALAVGESVVKEVVKAAVIGLVAVALQQATETVRDWRLARNPYTVAQAAHLALIDELATARGLRQRQAYEGEHTVLRVRLEIRSCVARVAAIPLEWVDKQRYWSILDGITAVLDHGKPDELGPLRRQLIALNPPPPSRKRP